MADIVTSSATRPLPPAIGRFGERCLADRLSEAVKRPAGCPSVEQFETRMAVVGLPRRVDRVA